MRAPRHGARSDEPLPVLWNCTDEGYGEPEGASYYWQANFCSQGAELDEEQLQLLGSHPMQVVAPMQGEDRTGL